MKTVAAFAVLGLASTAVASRKSKEYVRIPKVKHPQANDVSQVCINFTNDIDWYYLNAGGVWGTASGMNPSQVCVPTSNSAGGGMFIGPDPTPNANSTKIECFFPASGSTPANCDISIVNGYSLSATCSTSSISIGGDIDLWTGPTPCGTPSGANCANPIGPYATAKSQVSEFFQPADSGANTYCIWDLCPGDAGVDPNFPVSEQLTCHISGTKEG